MVNTRSTSRRGQMKDEDAPGPQDLAEPGSSNQCGMKQVETETRKSKSSHSKKSSASSVLARKKQIELEAAKEKARIQLDVLDKQLAADLAAVEQKYSPRASQCDSQGDGKDIEEWLERSQTELEKQKANNNGRSNGLLFSPSSGDEGTNGPVQQLASALKELVAANGTNSHNTNLLSRISTPRELPIFSGDPMDWLSFKNAFEESTDICKYSEKENLWRLRKCLRGPAKEAVSALLISTTSVATLMSTLELLYGSSDVIIAKILQEVKKLHPLPQEYHKDIVLFSVKIKNYVASVRALNREEYLQGVSVVNIVLAKLPTVLVSKWIDYSYPLISEGKKFRLELLSDFLNEEAIKTSTCSANLINHRWDNKRNNSESYNKSETVLTLTEKRKQSDNKCNFCRDFIHKLIDCKKFKKSLRKDRWSYVKRVGICYKCLVAKHDRQTCPAAPCDVDECGQAHHRLLHYVPSARKNYSVAVQQQPAETVPTETEPSTSSESVTHITNNCAVLLKVVSVNIHGPSGIFSASALLDDGSTVSMMSASLAARAGLSGHKQSMRVRGAWDNTELLCEVELLDLTLSNKLGEKYNICIRSVNELNLPKQNLTSVNYENYHYLRKIKDCDDWPRDVIGSENINLQLECLSVIHMDNGNLPVPEATRFSSWLRLLKSTSKVLAFVDRGVKAVRRSNRCALLSYDLDSDVMDRAERLLLRYSQAQSFEEEILFLKNSKSIPTTSKLLTLSPYLDKHGVLRVGGRIDAASDILTEIKRPAILDGQQYITRLIVKYYHTKAAHGNQEMVVNEIKQRYWVIRLRPTVKTVASKCMLCRLRKCKPEIPRMGDLPEGRIAHHQRPFTHCGVDLFGPMEVTIGRRHERRYGVLFTCLTVRAIHIETVSTLTTDSFIMALRRMAARRGWPKQMYSDNGTNLRGAHAELKKSIKELDEESLKNEMTNHGVAWTFIPPASPHWGGAWERLIRSVKTSLKVVLKERAPREEVFNTLLTEVEHTVNSRPLSHVSVDPYSKETLTPNHFLIGTSSNLPQVGKFNSEDIYLRKQWRISQRLADLFWQRWLKEVLPDLIPRKKWHQEQRALRVGDLVYVIDPNGARNTWPKGVIEEVYPGKDGRVRMIQVRTKTGIFTRPAARVARIPLTEECC